MCVYDLGFNCKGVDEVWDILQGVVDNTCKFKEGCAFVMLFLDLQAFRRRSCCGEQVVESCAPPPCTLNVLPFCVIVAEYLIMILSLVFMLLLFNLDSSKLSKK